MVTVQDIESNEFDAMPRSVIAITERVALAAFA